MVIMRETVPGQNKMNMVFDSAISTLLKDLQIEYNPVYFLPIKNGADWRPGNDIPVERKQRFNKH